MLRAKAVPWRKVGRLAPKIVWRWRRFAGLTAKPRALCDDFAMAVPFDYVPAPPSRAPRIAVVCHLFHVGIAAEIEAAVRNIPFAVDVFVTTDTEAKAAQIVKLFDAWSGAALDVRVIPNRGRDAAGKYVVFADVARSHDYVLYLHSKQDTHFKDGSAWRHYLLASLAGSPDIVRSVVAAFDHDAELGIILAQHWRPVRPFIGWTENYSHVQQIGARLGLNLRERDAVEFPAGSMFWARGAAMEPLLSLDLTLADMPDEPLPNDGTTLHAIERLVLFAVESGGYRWAKIARRDLSVPQETISPIASPGAVTAFLKRHGFALIRAGLVPDERMPAPASLGQRSTPSPTRPLPE